MINYITNMLFETIINKIKDMKNFEELSEYITSKFLYNRVEEYLKEIKLELNPKILLASFILKYEIDNNLYYPYNYSDNVVNILNEINILHDALQQNYPPQQISEIILNYVKCFKVWKDEDKKKIIHELKEDYKALKVRYNNEKNELICTSLLLIIASYKEKLLKLISEEEFNNFEKLCNEKIEEDKGKKENEEMTSLTYHNSIETFKNQMKKSYEKYLINNLKDNNFEVVTKNLVELREYILQCTVDSQLIEEINNELYIEYFSDEELYKFLYNYCNFLLRITTFPKDVEIIKEVKKDLNKNVSLDNEMYLFIPKILNTLFDIVEILIIEKNDYNI